MWHHWRMAPFALRGKKGIADHGSRQPRSLVGASAVQRSCPPTPLLNVPLPLKTRGDISRDEQMIATDKGSVGLEV